MTALNDIANRIVQAATSTSASANHVLVHRKLVGELREALRAQPGPPASKSQLTLRGEGGMGGELYFEHAADSFAVNLNGQLMFLSLPDAATLRDYLIARLGGETKANPVPLVDLLCPNCAAVHVDEGEWATRLHKTHQCQNCKYEWRPFPYATVGVASSEKCRRCGGAEIIRDPATWMGGPCPECSALKSEPDPHSDLPVEQS